MSRARDLSKIGNKSTLAVDTDNIEVGIGSTVPSSTLDVRGEIKVGTAVQLGSAGVVTATSFSGSGANLTNVGMDTGFIVSVATTAGNLTVSAAATISQFLTVGHDLTVSDSIAVTRDINVGSAGTFGGAVNIDATTDSTSTTTGALIVDGGAAIAKNVYIGAGLSVAGTLTYEDVTSVDSVGMVTAKSGVNVSGGQLQVGVAYSVGAAGVATALGLVAGASGFEQTGGGEFKVGIGVTIASTSGVSTFGSDVTFTGDGGKTCKWNRGNGAFELEDDALLKIGSGADLRLYHNGSHSFIDEAGTGNLYIRAGTDNGITLNSDADVILYYDNSLKFQTTNDGVNITGIATFSDGLHSNGLLRERANVVANKLSAGTNVEMVYGNVHYYSTNETTTATPKIRYNSTYSLNSKMTVGEAVTVTIIYKPNGAGYYAALTVDGSGVTEEWNGGSAPSSANAGGYDVLTHTLIKTGSGSWICLSNVQNFA